MEWDFRGVSLCDPHIHIHGLLTDPLPQEWGLGLSGRPYPCIGPTSVLCQTQYHRE